MILSSEIKDKDHNIYGNKNLAGKSICSSSSTTSKSIDDVWNDISLSSFHHHTTATATATTTTTHPLPFQDFFSTPTTTNPCTGDSIQFKPPPSTTSGSGGVIISLNSEPIGNNFLYKNSLSTPSQSCKCTELPNFFPSSKPSNFNSLAPLSSSLPVKRAQPEYCEKHKRLMKNRESASRFRARKQARTDELEIEVERLTKENAMLKFQLQHQLKLPNAIPAQMPKRSRLNSASTAPF